MVTAEEITKFQLDCENGHDKDSQNCKLYFYMRYSELTEVSHL